MSKVIIHAGMNKTGSTSIQSWLANNNKILREKYNLHVLWANTSNSDKSDCRLQYVVDENNSTSNTYIQIYNSLDTNGRQALINTFMQQLRMWLDKGFDVILSSEAFYHVLINTDNILEETL